MRKGELATHLLKAHVGFAAGNTRPHIGDYFVAAMVVSSLAVVVSSFAVVVSSFAVAENVARYSYSKQNSTGHQ